MAPKFKLNLALSSLPTDLRTDSASLPSFLEGGEHAVLLVHGFTGSPHDMRFLAESLHRKGFTVSVPRLPGHGTAGIDFMNSNRKDWLRRVVDAWLDLRCTYATVSVCGLSMGGVLSLILASHFPVERLVLAAPAVEVRSRFMWAAPYLGPLMPKIPVEPDPKHLNDPGLRKLTEEYWSFQWNRPAAELYRLMKTARKRLPSVVAPTMTIVSEKDETVPLSAASRIEKRIGTREHRTVVLTESAHVVTNDVEKQHVAQLVCDWLSGVTNAGVTSAGEPKV